MMLRLSVALALAAGLMASPVSAFYEEGGPVVVLTPDNFDEIVVKSKIPVMVEFFAPWCGHCKNLAPEWEKVAQKLRGITVVAALDADKYQDFAGRFSIKGFPTLHYYPVEVKHNPYKNNEPYKEHIDINAPRNARALTAFAHGKLPSDLVSIAASSDDIFNLNRKSSGGAKSKNNKGKGKKKGAAKDLPTVVIFAKSEKVRPLAKSLALRFKDAVSFVQAPIGDASKKAKNDDGDEDDDEDGDAKKNPFSEVMKEHGVTSAPAIALRAPGGEKLLFEGKIDGDAVAAWIEKVYPDAAVAASKEASVPPPAEFFVKVTDRNFQRRVTFGTNPLVILAIGPETEASPAGSEGKWIKNFNEVALASMGIADFAIVRGDVTTGRRSGKEALALLEAAMDGGDTKKKGRKPKKKSGAIVKFGKGRGKVYFLPRVDSTKAAAARKNAKSSFSVPSEVGRPVEYFPVKLSERKKINQWLGSKLPTAKNIVELSTPQDMQMFFQPKTQPQPGEAFPPKVVLFTKQEETGILYKTLANEFPDVGFAEVRASRQDIVKQFQVTKFPSLFVMSVQPTGEKDEQGNLKLALAPNPYPGPLKFGPIREFVTRHGAKGKSDSSSTDDLLDDGGASLVPRVNDAASFEEHCANKGGLCVIFAFRSDSLIPDPDFEPDSESDDDTNNTAELVPSKIDDLREAAALSAGKPLSFVWIDAERQSVIARSLGLDRRGIYPAAVAVNVRRGVFANFVGVFNAEHLAEFADEALRGKVSIAKIGEEKPVGIDEDDSEATPKEDL